MRDNTSFCTSWDTVYVGVNTTPPVIGSISGQDTLSCSNPSVVLQATNPGINCTWLPYNSNGSSISLVASSANASQTVIPVTLVVTDFNNGCQSSTVIPVYQNVFVPTASISPPPAVCSSTVVLTNQSWSGIPQNTFPAPSSVIAILWQGPSPQTTLVLSTSYTAGVSGIYSMTVMDLNNGCTKTATINVLVGPTPAFIHTITSGQATFNDISANTGTYTSYLWNFGDGTTSTLQNPTHTYASAGAYLVKLKLTNAAFMCSDSTIQSVNISGVACAANSNFAMVSTGTAQVWNAVPAYPWNVSAASWSWGDGTTSNTLYTSHQYAAAGMYNICLSVTISCGDTSTSCTSYSVYRTSEEAMIFQVNVVAPELVSGVGKTKQDVLSWSIAPNPNKGEFNLILDETQWDGVHVFITDLTGRVVYDELKSSSSIKTNLPQGMYLVTLERSQGRVVKRMVVVE